MKLTRIMAFLIALAMAVSALTFVASADDVAVLEVSSVQACRGDEVEVTVNLSNNPGIATIGFTLTYDTSAMTLTQVQNGEVFSANDFTTPAPGKAIYLANAVTSNVENNGKLATFKFTVNADADYDITNIGITNLDGYYNTVDSNNSSTELPVQFSTVDGTLEVYDPDGPIFRVISKKGFRGNYVDIAISVENNPGLALVGFDLEYDASVLTPAENFYTVGDVFTEDTFTSGDVSKNPYTFTFCDGAKNNNGDGTLITFTFKISDNATEGFYPITIKNIETYNFDEEAVRFTGLNGYAEVKTVLPGDVTGDGIVNRQDLLRLAKYFAGWDVEINRDASDVTGEGNVNRQDLLRLAKYFAGWDVTLG